MENMYALGMNSWCKDANENILNEIVQHERPTFLDIGPHVMVNETVIDNELKVNDLFIYPAWMVSPMGNVKQRNASRCMKTKDPRLCTVR